MTVRLSLLWILGLIALFVVFIKSLTTGAVEISNQDVLSYIFNKDDSLKSILLHDLRLPRAIAAVAMGAAFAVSGVLLQGITRNPLGCPSLLGVNQGTAFTMVAMMLAFPAISMALLVPVAFVGGLATATLTYVMAATVKASPLRLALAGVTVNALFIAGINSIMILFPERAQLVVFNLAGSLASVSWEQLKITLPIVVSCLIIACLNGPRVNILSVGNEQAEALGVNQTNSLLWLLVLSTILAASAVSVCGPIAFLGLLVPHVLRFFVGGNYIHLLGLSVLYGALVLTGADWVVHLVNPVQETPVGILLAILGVPVLLWVARHEK